MKNNISLILPTVFESIMNRVIHDMEIEAEDSCSTINIGRTQDRLSVSLNNAQEISNKGFEEIERVKHWFSTLQTDTNALLETEKEDAKEQFKVFAMKDQLKNAHSIENRLLNRLRDILIDSSSPEVIRYREIHSLIQKNFNYRQSSLNDIDNAINNADKSYSESLESENTMNQEYSSYRNRLEAFKSRFSYIPIQKSRKYKYMTQIWPERRNEMKQQIASLIGDIKGFQDSDRGTVLMKKASTIHDNELKKLKIEYENLITKTNELLKSFRTNSEGQNKNTMSDLAKIRQNMIMKEKKINLKETKTKQKLFEKIYTRLKKKISKDQKDYEKEFKTSDINKILERIDRLAEKHQALWKSLLDIQIDEMNEVAISYRNTLYSLIELEKKEKNDFMKNTLLETKAKVDRLKEAISERDLEISSMNYQASVIAGIISDYQTEYLSYEKKNSYLTESLKIYKDTEKQYQMLESTFINNSKQTSEFLWQYYHQLFSQLSLYPNYVPIQKSKSLNSINQIMNKHRLSIHQSPKRKKKEVSISSICRSSPSIQLKRSNSKPVFSEITKIQTSISLSMMPHQDSPLDINSSPLLLSKQKNDSFVLFSPEKKAKQLYDVTKPDTTIMNNLKMNREMSLNEPENDNKKVESYEPLCETPNQGLAKTIEDDSIPSQSIFEKKYDTEEEEIILEDIDPEEYVPIDSFESEEFFEEENDFEEDFSLEKYNDILQLDDSMVDLIDAYDGEEETINDDSESNSIDNPTSNQPIEFANTDGLTEVSSKSIIMENPSEIISKDISEAVVKDSDRYEESIELDHSDVEMETNNFLLEKEQPNLVHESNMMNNVESEAMKDNKLVVNSDMNSTPQRKSKRNKNEKKNGKSKKKSKLKKTIIVNEEKSDLRDNSENVENTENKNRLIEKKSWITKDNTVELNTNVLDDNDSNNKVIKIDSEAIIEDINTTIPDNIICVNNTSRPPETLVLELNVDQTKENVDSISRKKVIESPPSIQINTHSAPKEPISVKNNPKSPRKNSKKTNPPSSKINDQNVEKNDISNLDGINNETENDQKKFETNPNCLENIPQKTYGDSNTHDKPQTQGKYENSQIYRSHKVEKYQVIITKERQSLFQTKKKQKPIIMIKPKKEPKHLITQSLSKPMSAACLISPTISSYNLIMEKIGKRPKSSMISFDQPLIKPSIVSISNFIKSKSPNHPLFNRITICSPTVAYQKASHWVNKYWDIQMLRLEREKKLRFFVKRAIDHDRIPAIVGHSLINQNNTLHQRKKMIYKPLLGKKQALIDPDSLLESMRINRFSRDK